MIALNKKIKDTLKKYGDEAPARFGVNPTTLKRYMKRGHYPPALIEKIVADYDLETGGGQAEETEPAPQIVRPTHPAAQGARLDQISDYLQKTVDFYLKQFNDRIGKLEFAVQSLQVNQLRLAGVPSLARPDQGVPAEQVFTTSPFGHIGHPLDTGIAPTREQVEAQADMVIIEGVPVPGAQLARPATPHPSPPFGFGWNTPRPRK